MRNHVKAAIRDNFDDFLNGKEVKASVIGRPTARISPGDTVMAYKHSIAAESDVPVPRSQQAHCIGVEALVTEVDDEGITTRENGRVLKVRLLHATRP